MDNPRIKEIFCSPGGTTREISRMFCEAAGWAETTQMHLMDKNRKAVSELSPSEVAVVAVPVFFGRVPDFASEQLRTIKANGTPAIAMVVYGNRDYEDALVELTDILQENGFTVWGAGAFVARHSIFSQVAAERPDADDQKAVQDFAARCVEKLKSGRHTPVTVKGNRPYRAYPAGMPIRPTGSAACTKCGLCVRLCPAQAISAENPCKTDKKKCINCTTCIYHCPAKARRYSGPLYKIASRQFAKKCSERKTPEYFLQ